MITDAQKERGKVLADEHWQYMDSVLRISSGKEPGEIEEIGFHYRAAMEHGYGHGVEDKSIGKPRKRRVIQPALFPSEDME